MRRLLVLCLLLVTLPSFAKAVSYKIIVVVDRAKDVDGRSIIDALLDYRKSKHGQFSGLAGLLPQFSSEDFGSVPELHSKLGFNQAELPCLAIVELNTDQTKPLRVIWKTPASDASKALAELQIQLHDPQPVKPSPRPSASQTPLPAAAPDNAELLVIPWETGWFEARKSCANPLAVTQSCPFQLGSATITIPPGSTVVNASGGTFIFPTVHTKENPTAFFYVQTLKSKATHEEVKRYQISLAQKNKILCISQRIQTIAGYPASNLVFAYTGPGGGRNRVCEVLFRDPKSSVFYLILVNGRSQNFAESREALRDFVRTLKLQPEKTP